MCDDQRMDRLAIITVYVSCAIYVIVQVLMMRKLCRSVDRFGRTVHGSLDRIDASLDRIEAILERSAAEGGDQDGLQIGQHAEDFLFPGARPRVKVLDVQIVGGVREIRADLRYRTRQHWRFLVDCFERLRRLRGGDQS